MGEAGLVVTWSGAPAHPMNIVRVDPVGTTSPEWADLVRSDPRSLASHLPAWTEAHERLGSGRCAARRYELSDGRRFVLPMVRSTGGVARSFGSGWGMGGVVGGVPDAQVLAAVLDDLRSRPFVQVRIRPNPLHAESWRQAAVGRAIVVDRRAHVVDLAGGTSEVWRRLNRQCRSAIMGAERCGLEVDHATDGRLLADFELLYGQALDRWAADQHEPVRLARWRAARREPVGKWSQASTVLAGRCHVWIARLGGVPVAGSVVLVGNDAHETRRAVDRVAAGRVQAGRLLAWLALEKSVQLGCGFHHLGDSGWAAGVSQFKESFGARPVEYPEIRLERVPLSRIDAVARAAIRRAVGFREAATIPHRPSMTF